MAWNNVYLGTPNPVGNYQGSAASTVLSDLSISGGLDVDTFDAVTLNASGAVVLSSTLSVAGQLTLDAGATIASTLTSTDADFLSVDSAADASGMTTGQLRLVFLASGVSLMYSSGESQYEVGSSRSDDQS